MGQRLPEDLTFDTTYYPVVVCSLAFFLLFTRYVVPHLSSKFCPRYKAFSNSDRVDWDTRVASTVHAVVVSCMCVYTLLFDDEISQEPIWWDAPFVRTSSAIVFGYMIADMFMMLSHYEAVGEVSYFLHHGMSVFAYFYVTSFGILPYFANYRLVAEVSTPIVNQRWFLSKLGYAKSGRVFIANGLAMVAIFFLVRVAVMPSYYMRILLVYNTPGFDALGYLRWCMIGPSIMLDILNLVWFGKICAGALKALRSSREDPQVTDSDSSHRRKLCGDGTLARFMQLPTDEQKHID